VGVLVAVMDSVCVGVLVSVDVEDGVGWGVEVTVSVDVGDEVGGDVAVGVSVSVGEGVCVGLGV